MQEKKPNNKNNVIVNPNVASKQDLDLKGTLHLKAILHFPVLILPGTQNELHFMARRGNRDFVQLGETLAYVHERFLLVSGRMIKR